MSQGDIDEEHLRKVLIAHEIMPAERQSRILRVATRIIEAIGGKRQGVIRLTHIDEDTSRFNPAPSEIPRLSWTSTYLSEGFGDSDLRANISGSVGGFYAKEFYDERPSDVFNTGFYAGVLAVKEGLVDVADFNSLPIKSD